MKPTRNYKGHAFYIKGNFSWETMHHSDESEMQCNKGITFTSDAKSAFHYLKKKNQNNTSLTGKSNAMKILLFSMLHFL